MENKNCWVIYKYADWTVNDTWEHVDCNNQIKKTQCIHFNNLSDFEYYQSLDINAKIQYLLEHSDFITN